MKVDTRARTIKADWIEVSIDTTPPVVPPLMPEARPIEDQRPFVSKRTKTMLLRANKTIIDVDEAFVKYAEVLGMVNSFSDLFTDYDKEHVLPLTCALGIWKPNVTDLDAEGYMGLDSHVTLGDEFMKAMVEEYRRYLPPRDSIPKGLSLPRGKSIGWPYFVPSSNRSMNDGFLGLTASIVEGAKNQGMKSEELYSYLTPLFGAPFGMEGHRYQVTGRQIQMRLGTSLITSKSFAGRSRSVIAGPKISVIYSRHHVKRLTEMLLSTPYHNQDRDGIQKFITGYQNKGFHLLALDYSKFDFRFGGDRGAEIIKAISDILGQDGGSFYEDQMYEWNMRFFAFARGSYRQLPGPSILRSGIGVTSLIGCIGNHSYIVAALCKISGLTPKQVLAKRGADWDYLIWGDDIVFAAKDKMVTDTIHDALQSFSLVVEDEPTVKYLGSNYLPGKFSGSMLKGYSLGRFVQQQFFPETPRIPILGLYGYIARLFLLDPSIRDEVHSRMLPFFPHFKYNITFSLNQVPEVLKFLEPKILKIGNSLGQIDDILNIFTHGVNAMDAVDLIPGDLSKLLGLTGGIDLSDPAAVIHKSLEDQTVMSISKHEIKGLIKAVENISSGDLSGIDIASQRLASWYGVIHQPASVIY